MQNNSVDIYSNIIYIGAVVLSIIISELFYCYEQKRKSVNTALKSLIISLPMSLILGLRSINVGYDTYMYSHYYYGRLEALPKREQLFVLIVKILRYHNAGTNYTIMLLVFSFLLVFFSIYAVLLFDNKCNLNIFILCYGCIFFLCATDQFRQLLAVALFACAIAMWKKKKKVIFLLYIIAAFEIHNSSIFALILFFVCFWISKTQSKEVEILVGTRTRIYTKVNYFATICVCVAIVITAYFYIHIEVLAKIISYIDDSYSSYFTSRVNVQSVGLGLIIDIFPIIPLFSLREYLDSRIEKALFYYSFLAIIFRLFGYVSYFLYRMMYYPEMIAFILYAYVFQNKNLRKATKYILIIISISYYIIQYVYLNNHGAFPYEFFWNLKFIRNNN